MFVPYSTDAPIYHWPIATVGIIVANVLVTVGMATGAIEDPDFWVMPYNQGLTPTQWVLSMFAHADLGHLLGNMLFLWIFGLVVEGKLGWQRFLTVYLAIGAVQSAGEQTLMVLLGGSEGGSLGASSAIFGIMAIAAIWAPKNNISIFYWLFFVFVGTFELPILTIAFLYIGYDFFLLLFQGIESSSWLHVGGVMVGAPIGIILLKKGIVDCEGWDIFRVYSGNYGAFVKKPDLAEMEAEVREKKQLRDSQLLDNAPKQVVQYLKDGNSQAAYTLYKKVNPLGNGLQLPQPVMMRLITWLHRAKLWRESCPLMAEVLERFPAGSEAVRVSLAQICVVELNRPGKALDLLRELNAKQMPKNLLELARKISRVAQQQQADGTVELDDGGW